MNVKQILSLNNFESESIGKALSKAFHREPNFTYIIPNATRRSKALKWFFGSFVPRLGLRYGKIYIHENYFGAAIWVKPGEKVTLGGSLRAGLLTMPFYFGFNGIKRSMILSNYVERTRGDYAPEKHWYLMALAVDPDAQNKGIGSSLIRPILDIADKEKINCYLETFSSRGIKFYNRFSFKVIKEHQVPQGGPLFWSMIRKPANL